MVKTKNEVQEALERADAALDRAVKYLNDNGVEYQLDDWLTVKRYCERFGIKDTQIVTNWIKRGVIPPENVVSVEELNGLRLIKAVPYRDRE